MEQRRGETKGKKNKQEHNKENTTEGKPKTKWQPAENWWG